MTLTALAIVAISILFGVYAFFDLMSVYARVAGSLEGRNALGASFEKAMNTLKRAFMFFYPPILGLLISFERIGAVYVSIFVAFALATAIALAGLFLMTPLVRRLRRSLVSYVEGQSLVWSIILPRRRIEGAPKRPCYTPGIVSSITKHRKLFAYSCWIYFIYSSSIFMINVLAIEFIEYSAVLFQTIGAYNALGTVLMSFIVDPVISRYLDDGDGVESVALSVVTAQVAVYALISPLFFLILLAIFANWM